jgi:hypothetical protein
MYTMILVVVGIVAVGAIIGALARSSLALLYPLVLMVGWRLWWIVHHFGGRRRATDLRAPCCCF